jgi:hypothetical protein
MASSGWSRLAAKAGFQPAGGYGGVGSKRSEGGRKQFEISQNSCWNAGWKPGFQSEGGRQRKDVLF